MLTLMMMLTLTLMLILLLRFAKVDFLFQLNIRLRCEYCIIAMTRTDFVCELFWEQVLPFPVSMNLTEISIYGEKCKLRFIQISKI